jgi:CheY-like chemotaxis protein
MTIKILIIDDNEKDIKIMKHQLANNYRHRSSGNRRV